MPDDTPFRRYRDPDGKIVLAHQRSEPFETTLHSGRIDQRKAGARRAVDLRYVTKGKAGDYEVIHDQYTGQRAAVARKAFEVWYTLDPSENEAS